MSIKKYTDVDFNKVRERLMESLRVHTDAQVASVLGFSKAAFSERKRRNSLPVKEIELLCKRESINIDWLLTGEGEMRQGLISNAEILDIKMVAVDVYSLAGAGKPMALTDPEPTKTIYVPEKWSKPSIVSVSVRGESMQPGIMDGSIVGIDTADKQIVSGKVFAVWIEHEGAVIKRVYAEAERVVLKSDNPAFEPIYINDGHGFILGRLRWAVQEY